MQLNMIKDKTTTLHTVTVHDEALRQCKIAFVICAILFLSGRKNFISVLGVVTCEIKHWNNFEIISK